MNIPPARHCKYCRFYHGVNNIVCAIHPYGPDSKVCSDFVPESNELAESSRSSWSISQFDNRKGWQKLLLAGLLAFGVANGFVVWLTSDFPQPAVNSTSKSEFMRQRTR